MAEVWVSWEAVKGNLLRGPRSHLKSFRSVPGMKKGWLCGSHIAGDTAYTTHPSSFPSCPKCLQEVDRLKSQGHRVMAMDDHTGKLAIGTPT